MDQRRAAEIRDLLNATPTKNLRGLALLFQEIVAERARKDEGQGYDWNSLSSAELERLREMIGGVVASRRDT